MPVLTIQARALDCFLGYIYMTSGVTHLFWCFSLASIAIRHEKRCEPANLVRGHFVKKCGHSTMMWTKKCTNYTVETTSRSMENQSCPYYYDKYRFFFLLCKPHSVENRTWFTDNFIFFICNAM